MLPGKVTEVFDFIGRCAVALPKAMAAPGSVNWRALPRLLQGIGADGLVVTGAANLLVGLIVGLLGISQLGAVRRRRLCPRAWSWSPSSASLAHWLRR